MASKILPFFISTLTLLLQLHFSAGEDAIRAGYYFSSSNYSASDINSTLFSHLYFGYADLDNQTNQVVIPSSKEDQFSTFTETVQKLNPAVITILSIGGRKAKENFASITSQPSSRKSFIESSINLARSQNFHGLELNWDFPSTVFEMFNLGLLLNEWREAIINESTRTCNSPLLLAAAVFRSANYYTLGYPIQALANSLDWINVMSYNFFGPHWSKVTGPPAALFNPFGDDQNKKAFGITTWFKGGVPPIKVVLGLPFNGYAWRLEDPNNHGFFAPTLGPALSTDGLISYKQIRDFIKQNSATTVFNASVVSNYCYSGTTWIGYDDTDSISSKVSYAKDNGLLGYFASDVTADDNWLLAQTAFRTWGGSTNC